MIAYKTNDFAIHIPEFFKDKTVNIFSVTEDGPSEFSVVVTRDRPSDNENIKIYVERKSKELSKSLPKLTLIECVETMLLDGRSAMKLEFTWEGKEGLMHQRQLSTMTTSAHGPRVLTFTASSMGGISPHWNAMFDEMISSLRPAG